MSANPLTLTLYPNAFGMGYVICESPQEIINYGVARIRPLTPNSYVTRLHRFMKQYNPTLIILRGYREQSTISPRIKKVIQKFEQEAIKREIPIVKYTRKQMKDIFTAFGSPTKYGISKTLSKWYPELKSRMPDLRRNTQAEHYQMGVFDAFALMLTHYYME